MTENTEQNMQEVDETANDNETYKPRNKIVGAKERFYDRLNLSVRQVDIFIGVCVVVMLLLVFGSRFLF